MRLTNEEILFQFPILVKSSFRKTNYISSKFNVWLKALSLLSLRGTGKVKCVIKAHQLII